MAKKKKNKSSSIKDIDKVIDNENFLDVYKDYENIVSKKYLYNVWSGINWKGID